MLSQRVRQLQNCGCCSQKSIFLPAFLSVFFIDFIFLLCSLFSLAFFFLHAAVHNHECEISDDCATAKACRTHQKHRAAPAGWGVWG